MSGDFVPEEERQAYHWLLTALRSAAQRRVPITAAEQAEIIAHVRERLAHAAPASTPDVGGFAPRDQLTPLLPARQARKPTRFVAHLLAALVVIGLILGSWALFRAYPFSTRTTGHTPVSETGPTVQVQAGGLVTSMHVLIGGPYFLSELLPVDVSFTNHTQRPAGLDGSLEIANNSIANACFPSALLVQVTKGSNPSYTLPELDFACAQPYFVTEVEPSQTITIHQYIPLTKSGEVTLTRGLPPSDRTGGDPLDRQWPTVHMQVQVNPQVPQGRALSLQNQKGQALLIVPAGAKTHLLYMQSLTCENYGGGTGQWMPLSTNVLHEPACPTAHRHWTYIVGAPGYSTVSGSQSG
jgi:hypothetical protein